MSGMFAKVAGVWQELGNPFVVPPWTQRTNNPLTSLADLVTAGGAWDVSTGLLRNTSVDWPKNFATAGAAANNTPLAGYSQIAEAEIEIPSWLTANTNRRVGVGFNTTPAASGSAFYAALRGNNQVALYNTVDDSEYGAVAYTIPATGTWVKVRLKWDTATNLYTLYVNGVQMTTGTSGGVTFATTRKASVLVYAAGTAGLLCRFRNMKSWSLVPTDPA